MRPETPLVARSTRLDIDVDPFTFAGSGGFLWLQEREWMAGRGAALRVPVARGPSDAADAAGVAATVTAAIGAIPTEGNPESPGVRAFGAIPFGPGRPADLVIPEVLVGKSVDGTRWVTTVTPAGSEPPDLSTLLSAGGTTAKEPATYTIRPARPPQDWCAAVAAATEAIRAGRAVKVVLAREVTVDADAPFDIGALAQRLRAAYPSCTTFAFDGVLGASPELLVSRHGDIVRSHPLAGTAPRSSDPSTDARLAAGLLASAKNRWEHQITIDRVHETLLPYCSYLDAEAEPSIVAVANVQHLGTMVEGRLSSPAPSALELALKLHPTPAVCGEPRDAALALIEELEALDRGRYAGTAGWVDGGGDGEWVVAIRTAEIDGTRARVFAGNGIVEDSDPDTELAETRAKLQAMLSALVRP